MSTDLAAPQDTSTEVAERQAALDALRAQQEAEFADEPFQVPILKIGEALTKEVQDDDNPAQAGDFINSLTGASLGREIEFISAYYQPGRFAADRATNKAYVAFGDLIPEAWEPLVGESFVGTRFDEYPDAEEIYRARANDPNDPLEWGKGPLVSTTHNYTGLAVVPERDDLDQIIPDLFELQPVRLSLKRTNVSAHRTIAQLRKMSLRPPKEFWSRVFVLKTERKQFTSGASHLVIPTLGRATNAREQEAAVELAMAVAAGRVTDNQADDSGNDRPVEPEAKGGLGL